MKFSVDKQDGLVIYELLEEKLTSLNAPILKSELVLANAEGYKNVVVDLDKVRFVDSSGLSALLIGHRLCKDEKGIFGLCGLNDTVKKSDKNFSVRRCIACIFYTTRCNKRNRKEEEKVNS